MIGIEDIELCQKHLEPEEYLFLEDGQVELGQRYRDQIIALNTEGSHLLATYEQLNFPFTQYPDVASYFKDIQTWNSAGVSDKQIKKWLFGLGIPFCHRVLLSIHSNKGFVLTWKMILKHHQRIFAGSDQTLYDRTLNWWLTYHHDGEFCFCKNRIYSPEKANQEWVENQNNIHVFIDSAGKSEGRKQFSVNPFRR